jgi:hypothetical protein
MHKGNDMQDFIEIALLGFVIVSSALGVLRFFK